MVINETERLRKPEEIAEKVVAGNVEPTPLLNPDVSKREKPKFTSERPVDVYMNVKKRSNSDETITDDFHNTAESTIIKDIINDSILRSNSPSYAIVNIPQNMPTDKVIFNKEMITEHTHAQQKIQMRSSEVASLNEDVDIGVKSYANNNVSVKMMDDLPRDNSQELSAKLASSDREEIFKLYNKNVIEVNANSNLIARSGTRHRVVFDVSNNFPLRIIYEFQVTSTPYRILSVQPRSMLLLPGQTGQVAVDIFIPGGVGQNTVNTITVSLGSTQISEKTVYVYVQDSFSKIIDDVKPTIEYSFNNNCADKLNRNTCDKTLWSADITVQDYDSGLKSVISSPNDLYPRTKFVSGTKDRVTFHYISTCCSTTARITAIDVAQNQYTRTIDVTAWDNLSTGQIAAISLGVLLLLLLLVVIVIAIVYCVRRRNSHDLPYTQRYGSRQPPRSQRTSF